MNATEDLIRVYIEEFHATLEHTAVEFVTSELRSRLLHLSLLPARIVGYVSTQYGVAIEYFPSDHTAIETVLGNSRIEDLVFRVPHFLRRAKSMFPLDLNGGVVNFSDISLVGGFPLRLDGPRGCVTYDRVGFEIGTWKYAAHHLEIYCDRSAASWSREKAISKAKDEVLAALTDIRRAEAKGVTIEGYISTFKRKTVLVLGDYGVEGKQRLRTISSCLAALGYEPVLVEEIPDHPPQDLTQKVVMIGSAARFVVMDDSSRSGHLSELPICKSNSWVTILLRLGGKGGSWMTAGASHSSNVILEKEYEAGTEPLRVREAAEWAERKLAELGRELDSTYPWRTDPPKKE